MATEKVAQGAGVKPGDPKDPRTTNQGQVNAQATAANPSGPEYLLAISTHQIPRYDPNDVPLNEYAGRVFSRLGQILPTICGGGVFGYTTYERGVGPISVAVGGIGEYDSQSGRSVGSIGEIGGGEGVVAGGGAIVTAEGTTGLIYGGAGLHTPIVSGSVGVVGFPSGIGAYTEGGAFGKMVGVGAYMNIKPNAACANK